VIQMGSQQVNVSQYKKEVVKHLVSQMKSCPLVGVVNMRNMPAPQLQRLRAKTREKVNIVMCKRRLIRIALREAEASKPGIIGLEPRLDGIMPALVFTDENPFRLARVLEENKSKAPAKPGQIAPQDLVISAGPTPFSPGPVISELAQLGIKTGVDGGKVTVKQEAVVAKKDEEISAQAAGLLTKFGIEPMEIGLDLVAVFEDGVIFTREILAISPSAYVKLLAEASSQAKALAIRISYPAAEVIRELIARAFLDAMALAVGRHIMADKAVRGILAKASSHAHALKGLIN